MKHWTLLLILGLGYSGYGMAAKAICTVKNSKTHRHFISKAASSSYSVAKERAIGTSMWKCANTGYFIKACKVQYCYKQ